MYLRNKRENLRTVLLFSVESTETAVNTNILFLPLEDGSNLVDEF